MVNFAWRPSGASDNDPAITIVHDDYGGDAQVVVPYRYVRLEQHEVITRDGETHGAVALTMPARALAEFGLRAARDRVEALLTKLIGDLDEEAVES